MNRILLNADVGERGPDHPADLELMRWLDIANIACGGHAGDAESVAVFTALARKHGVLAAAHLSYPDRANFGRVSCRLSVKALRGALDAQRALLPEAALVKFHGALYNDSCADKTLAGQLVEWLRDRGISRVITFADSELAELCRGSGIAVLAEAFAERRYVCSSPQGRLALMNRSLPEASITDLAEAIEQARALIQEQTVRAFVEEKGRAGAWRRMRVKVATLCVHSDSPISPALARGIARLLGKDQPAEGGR
jgi:UPF0271 protein